MALDREQHVAETAEHMTADRLALKRAGNRPHLALVGGNTEVVRPEPDQALGKSGLGRERGVEARLRFRQISLLRRDADGRPRASVAIAVRVFRLSVFRLRIVRLRLFGLGVLRPGVLGLRFLGLSVLGLSVLLFYVVLPAGFAAHLAPRLLELD